MLLLLIPILIIFIQDIERNKNIILNIKSGNLNLFLIELIYKDLYFIRLKY